MLNSSSAPPATVALIGISVVVYLLMTLFGHTTANILFISESARPLLPEVRGGEWWRLITPVFVHLSIFHIVFNLLWVWELGRLIESRHGALGLLGITVVIAIATNLAQYTVTGPWFGGMSGVLYGYLGYLWIQGRFNPTFGIRLNPTVVYLLLGWLVICWSGVLSLLFDLHIANTAHSVGLLGGIALAAPSVLSYQLRK